MPPAPTGAEAGHMIAPVLLFVVISMSVVAVKAYGGMSSSTRANRTISASSTTGATIFIQAVNESTMSPVAGMPVFAGPISSPSDVGFTPGGPTLAECFHGVPSGSTFEENGSGVLFPNGMMITFPPCPLKAYAMDASGRVSISNVTGYYYIKIGKVMQWNHVIVDVEGNGVFDMTIPWPSGNVTLAQSGTSANWVGSSQRTFPSDIEILYETCLT